MRRLARSYNTGPAVSVAEEKCKKPEYKKKMIEAVHLSQSH
jgi:hypothetical protein